MIQKFSLVGEKEVTRAIVTEFTAQFAEYVDCDCIVIGGGPSGVMAGRNLARAEKKFSSSNETTTFAVDSGSVAT